MNALQRDLILLTDRVERADGPRAAQDASRLRCHLMPPVGWLNDPNGLCKIGDTYHVFYQYSPFNAAGGVKLWGHFTSTDLLHWQRQKPMLYPDMPFDCHGAYSGSALVEDGVLYLYYTGNVKFPGQYDYIKAGRGHNTCLAISRDGVTLDSKQCLMENKDYPAGLTCHVRDPKVWREGTAYYMVQGARTLEDRGEVLVFTSDDKINWRHSGTITTPQPFGYMWECPDLFCLNGQWFLAVSPQGAPCQNIYACGYFPLSGNWRDGSCTLGAFTPFDYGFDFYAPQSFADGARRLQFAWMGMPDADYGNPTVENGWQHALTVPCVLNATGETLLRTPAPELAALRGPGTALTEGTTCKAAAFDAVYTPEHPTAPFRAILHGGLLLEFTGSALRLQFTDAAIAAGRTLRTAPCTALDNLRILADTTSVEIFANGGALCMSTRVYPKAGAQGLALPQGAGAGMLYPIASNP